MNLGAWIRTVRPRIVGPTTTTPTTASGPITTPNFEERKKIGDAEWAKAGYSKEGAEALEREGFSQYDFLEYTMITFECYPALIIAAITFHLGRVIDAELQRDPQMDPYDVAKHNHARCEVATMCGHLEIVKQEVEKKTGQLHSLQQPAVTERLLGIGSMAAGAGRLSVLQYLVRKKHLEPNERTARPSLAWYACHRDHLDVVVWLMRHTQASWSVYNPEILNAHGDCLWWILRQPGSHGGGNLSLQGVLRVVRRLSICVGEWGKPVHVDLRGRQVGNNLCFFLGRYLHQMQPIAEKIDLSENPRIGFAGFRYLVCYLLMHNPGEKPIFICRRVERTQLVMSGLSVQCINDFNKRVRAKKRKKNPVRVELVCPFPSLVTIVSCWIADRIGGDKSAEQRPPLPENTEPDPEDMGDDDGDDDAELSPELKKDLDDHEQKLNRLKAKYTATCKQDLEADASLKGCWIVFYKDRVWCKTARCTSFFQVLQVFQKAVKSKLEDVFYVTRIGYPDAPIPTC